jgi:hypothetical protein
MLMSPTQRPSSRAYLSRRSMSPVPHNIRAGSVENLENIVAQLGSPGHPAVQQIIQEKVAATAGQSLGPPLVPTPTTSPAIMPPHPNGEILKKLAKRHILNAGMFNKTELHALFNLAQSLRTAVHKDRQMDHILRVRELVIFLVTIPIYKYSTI